MKKISILFLAILLPILVSTTTTRANGDLIDLSAPDVIEITANDRTSAQFPSFTALELPFTENNEPNPFVYNIGTRSGTHNATYNTAVYLTEANGTISDIVELVIVSTNGVQNWTLKFFSDTESPLQPLTDTLSGSAVQVQETGDLQDISGDFLNSDGVTRISPLFNVSVKSDVAAVPEPGTMLLLGSGLAGLWGIRRKFKK